jgi:mannosyltransferase OCH1-like enzyme
MAKLGGAAVIPKILLSCWFGRGRKSDLFLQCQESKRRVLPDWLTFECNEDTIDPAIMASPYMQAVQARGEFVKMTEIGRLWALHRFGGVYMDEDVEALKPFDPLLNNQFFIGWEDTQYINGAVMGSVAGGETVSALLKAFPLDSDGSKKATAYGPVFLTEQLRNVDCVKFEPKLFYPWHHAHKLDRSLIGPDSFALHHWAGSWKPSAQP